MEETNNPRRGLEPEIADETELTDAKGSPATEAVTIEAIREHPSGRATGPRTVRGKQKSRYNALKHGIFAQGILEDRESKADYHLVLTGLLEDFQPEGALEELLVEKLAMLFWRYRRLLRAEREEIEEIHRPSLLSMHQDTSDRIVRYEVSLERAIDRTLNQLERLQRMRSGQPVPAPLKVELSE